MEHYDWNSPGRGEEYRFSFEQPEPPKRDRRGGPILLSAVLCLGLILCLAGGAKLRFRNTESGSSLPQNQELAEETMLSGEMHENPAKTVQPELPVLANPQTVPDQIAVSGGLNPARELELSSGGDELSLKEIYKLVHPSTVSICASSRYGTSYGSGIILSEDGYLATNAHVVSSGEEISVTLSDSSTFPAELIGADTISDLAVLKIEAVGLTPAEFGDSDALEVGDRVAAIGDPLGIELRGTLTDGIISAINRDLQFDSRRMTLLQTNAALNEGNSGGPLINFQGKVIGINTMKLSSSYSSIEGLGFAIPSKQAMPILNELMQQGYISGRPDFGFTGITVPSYAQLYYRLPSGVYLQDVDADSDAAAKGLLPGDVITQLDGGRIDSMDDLDKEKNSYSAGDIVELVVYRRGIYYRVQITLEEAVGQNH